MINFSPKIEDSTDEQLKNNINLHQPDFGSLSSDELTRRSLNKLRETIVDLDKSNKRFSLAFGLFALFQIVIAGLSLVMDIKANEDVKFSIFMAVMFIGVATWFTRQFGLIDKDK